MHLHLYKISKIIEVTEMKKFFMLFIVAVLAVVMVACGSSNPKKEETTGSNAKGAEGTPEVEEVHELTIKHQLDETVVKKNPEKVIVFDFGTLDSLDKMGIDVIALPKANIPPYLSKFEDEKYVNVGSLKEPDFEKIHELQPDLIIISARQADLYEEFKAIAPTVYLGIDNAKYMESFQENAKTLASIFEKEEMVEQELKSIDETVKAVQDAAVASGKNALVVLANEGKVSAYGPNSRFGLIHDVLGFAPVDENIEVSTHGQGIDFEYIAEKNPDFLFVVDRGAVVAGGGDSSAKQVIENELVKKTNAFKEGKIIYLDANYWYLSGGGLVSVAEMVKEVEASLQ